MGRAFTEPICRRCKERPVDRTKAGRLYNSRLCRVCRKMAPPPRAEPTMEELETMIAEQLPTMPGYVPEMEDDE